MGSSLSYSGLKKVSLPFCPVHVIFRIDEIESFVTGDGNTHVTGMAVCFSRKTGRRGSCTGTNIQQTVDIHRLFHLTGDPVGKFIEAKLTIDVQAQVAGRVFRCLCIWANIPGLRRRHPGRLVAGRCNAIRNRRS